MTLRVGDPDDEGTVRETIANVVSDLVSNFLYYDRKESRDLPCGRIDSAVATGEVTVEEIVELFDRELRKGLTA